MGDTVQRIARDGNTRFRITPWPGRLPHPGHGPRFEYTLLASGGIVQKRYVEDGIPPVSARDDPLPPPPHTEETYLRLIAVDLEDPGAIMGFIDQYGILGMRWEEAGFPVDGDYLNGWPLHSGSERLGQALNQSRAAAVTELAPPDGQSYWVDETLDEFRFGATLMRDLVACWRLLSEEIEPESWECPLWYPEQRAETYPWTDNGPEFVLSSVLGEGLRSYSPTLMLSEGDDTPSLYHPGSLWFVLCLELFNHIVDNSHYRLCHNKTCGRLFVLQEGRAAHGQHRTRGVKYCSADCARAQAQREYRRRKLLDNRRR
jgi:hypothetical protein